MTNAASEGISQAQSNSAEQDHIEANDPRDADEVQHFDTTIVKLVERETEDGETEWVEVMSDNLYPGEKLKTAEDDELQARKAELARAKASEASKVRREAEDEVLKKTRALEDKAKSKSKSK